MARPVTSDIRSRYGFSSEWLEACIDWCRQSNLARTDRDLWRNVQHQWLTTDIRDDGVQNRQQIKPAWQKAKKIVIKEMVYLQVLKQTDISKPAMVQLQANLKLNNDNSSVSAENQNRQPAWEPKPNRCLSFTLTDGFKTIGGIEHESLNESVEIFPGGKIEIKGPIVCRNGKMLFTGKNVTVLGGQVEALMEEFNENKILRERLGQDANSLMSRPLLNQLNNQLPPSPPPPIPSERANAFADDDDDDDFFNNLELPDEAGNAPPVAPPVNKVAKVDYRTRVVSKPKPFTYLQYVPKTPDRWTEDVNVIKGCVIGIAHQLRIAKLVDKSFVWALTVIIGDGSDTRNFGLSQSLLLSWLGTTPANYAKSKNSTRSEMKAVLDNFRTRLLNFNGLIKLKVESGSIVISEMIPLNRGHLQQLKKRRELA